MIKKEILHNNVRLLSIPKKETEVVNLLAMVKCGSRYETDKVFGGSHFLEHLMFKGTKKRPNTLAISKELDAIGAEYNAFTAKDYTGYYVKAHSKHFKNICDIVFDMLNNSVFDKEEFVREKNVILEEIKMYEDNPLMYIDDIFDEIIYKGNDLGKLIAGTRESINKMELDELLKYHDRLYSGNNFVVGIAGNISKSVNEICRDYFSKYSFKKEIKSSFEPFVCGQNIPQITLLDKDTEQAQVILGFPSYEYKHPKLPALKLLTVILGGNMSSRLFISIRERRGLAYFIKSSVDVYEDTGSFKIQAGLNTDKTKDAIKNILMDLKMLMDKGITEDELQRAKDYIEGKIYLSLEDTSDLAAWYVKQEVLLNEIKTPQDRIDEINKVTKEDVEEVAKEIFSEQKINLAIIGPFKEEKEFLEILKF